MHRYVDQSIDFNDNLTDSSIHGIYRRRVTGPDRGKGEHLLERPGDAYEVFSEEKADLDLGTYAEVAKLGISVSQAIV